MAAMHRVRSVPAARGETPESSEAGGVRAGKARRRRVFAEYSEKAQRCQRGSRRSRRAREFHHGLLAPALLALASTVVGACSDAPAPEAPTRAPRTPPAPALDGPPEEVAEQLVSTYRTRFPLPRGPWQGLGTSTHLRSRLAANERQLLAAHATAPPAERARLALDLGGIYTQVEEHERGMAFLLESFDAHRERADVWFWLGTNRLSAGHADEAVILLERARELSPADPVVLRFLGESRHRLGDTDAAIAHWREALRAAPDYLDALASLGQALDEFGRSAEALPHLLELVRLDPEHPSGHFVLARVLEDLGRPDEAAEARRMHDRATIVADRGWRDSGQPRAHVLVSLGIVYIERGDCADAERELRTVLTLDPDQQALGMALVGLTDCLLQRSALDEADATLSRLERELPNHPMLPQILERARGAGLR